jgi:hypothetical protein
MRPAFRSAGTRPNLSEIKTYPLKTTPGFPFVGKSGLCLAAALLVFGQPCSDGLTETKTAGT